MVVFAGQFDSGESEDFFEIVVGHKADAEDGVCDDDAIIGGAQDRDAVVAEEFSFNHSKCYTCGFELLYGIKAAVIANKALRAVA